MRLSFKPTSHCVFVKRQGPNKTQQPDSLQRLLEFGKQQERQSCLGTADTNLLTLSKQYPFSLPFATSRSTFTRNIPKTLT